MTSRNQNMESAGLQQKRVACIALPPNEAMQSDGAARRS